ERILRLTGTITHLDELLTMSAKMYAATGNPAWEQRYQAHVALLEEAFQEAQSLISDNEMRQSAAITAEANHMLIEMETQALDAVRSGEASRALALLESSEYNRQKAKYEAGMNGSLRLLSEKADRRASRLDQQRTWWLYGGMGLVVALLLAAAWLGVGLARREAAALAAEEATAKAEKRLRRQNTTLAELSKRQLAGVGDWDNDVRAITEAAASTLDVARASIWLLDADQSVLQCEDLFESASNRHTAGLQLPTGSYPNYLAALYNNETLAAHDALIDPRTAEFAEGYLKPLGITSMLDALIRAGGRLAGVVCVEHIGAPRTWTLDEQTFAAAVSNLLSLSLEAQRKRVAEAELLQTAATLRESEARYHRMSANAPGMVYQFVLRADGSAAFPFVSDGCREIFNLEPEFIRQDAQHLIKIIHPEDRPLFNSSVAESAASLLPWKWEGRFTSQSGEIRWVHGASRPERQANGDTLWDGLLIDITPRKRAEEALRQAHGELERRVEERTAELSNVNAALQSNVDEQAQAELRLRRRDAL
ncbi:MAG TPA: GAF domain-containing protein, partial [Tepidisphaeraceae bacterium]